MEHGIPLLAPPIAAPNRTLHMAFLALLHKRPSTTRRRLPAKRIGRFPGRRILETATGAGREDWKPYTNAESAAGEGFPAISSKWQSTTDAREGRGCIPWRGFVDRNRGVPPSIHSGERRVTMKSASMANKNDYWFPCETLRLGLGLADCLARVGRDGAVRFPAVGRSVVPAASPWQRRVRRLVRSSLHAAGRGLLGPRASRPAGVRGAIERAVQSVRGADVQAGGALRRARVSGSVRRALSRLRCQTGGKRSAATRSHPQGVDLCHPPTRQPSRSCASTSA